MRQKLFYIFSMLIIIFLNKIHTKEASDINFSNHNLIISQKDINTKIEWLAKKIDEDYKGKEIVFLTILKGAFIFTSDLIRKVKTPFSVEMIKCSSYGGKQRKELSIQGLKNLNLKSKHVIIIDDIFDSGATIFQITKKIKEQKPASVKSLTLLVKRTKNRLKNINLPDYSLFEIEDKFVVGYGMDCNEHFRGLNGIYAIESF